LVESIFFILSFLVQLGFLLVVFSRLIWHKEIPAGDSEQGVSVIVAAHNERLNLEYLVNQLVQQDYPNFEIIIVNDRSTDGTYEYLCQNVACHPIVKMIHIEKVGLNLDPKKNALTKGIAAAENPILLFTDADCLPMSTSWIKEMTTAIDNRTQITLGYSPYLQKKGLLNQLIRFETFYTALQYLGLTLVGHPYMGVGRNLAYAKNLFVNNQGHQSIEGITGGDDDLFVQKHAKSGNTSIRINKDSQTISYPKTTYSEWFNQKKRHLSVGRYYKFENKVVLGLLTLSHAVFYLSLVLVLLNSDFILVGIIGWFLRTMVIIAIFTAISKRLGEKFSAISLPLLDFLYIINYLVVGFTAAVSRKITWR
jgi:glycosyltransferase involved in cell wall biosynthesis